MGAALTVEQPDISIVIPCYEEEGSIARLFLALSDLAGRLASEGRTLEVVAVDDGSGDGTWDRLCEASIAHSWVRAVRFRRHYGQAAAMQAGFSFARGRYIVPMDADLQNDPADVPMLVAKLEEGFDLVSGWRRRRRDSALVRRLPSRVANRIVSWVSGVRLHDYGCTLKAYRREVLEHVRLYGEMHRYLPVFAHHCGARITEVEVRHHRRREGRSKYGLGRTFRVLFDLLTVRLLGRHATSPMYMFGRGALILTCLAVLAALVATVRSGELTALFGLAPVLLVLGAVQLLGMGLLAELVMRTRFEAQGKNPYLIAETSDTRNSTAESAATEVSGSGRRVA